MTKHKQSKSIEKPSRLLPIMIVPDKTYIDDEGNVIPTDVILIADLTIYWEMETLLVVWKEGYAKKLAVEISGQKGDIEG